ncbi:MAG TPA: GIY-YIG nuclease family protein [Cyclobacteriaceae bacterium]|nr:GIY-YIG nuclease family protein [Cyclobacteriaceae bacterium]HMV09776.1 GIY-YIG nuclease family protein [Cyclobacteriaceae bacterium]HMV90287.1 GIY-YIG nuclease family protein [Cyclobacteriaceae bacterium]HMX00514.1 GIY-YIG nuclease family protein [Cyclobacteriaceae bacterium]HMX51824.1 GIY-YIG nuclease family protein [Cyclobacteriaceae bacterium]
MFSVYVLYSERFKKIYIGYTSDLSKRLESHNQFSTSGYTAKFRPWRVVLVEEFGIKSDAIRRERQLKSAQGRKFIKALLPESETKTNDH